MNERARAHRYSALFVVAILLAPMPAWSQDVSDIDESYRIVRAYQDVHRAVAQEVLPVTVQVNVVDVVSRPNGSFPAPFEFFGMPNPGNEFERSGLGSGVVVRHQDGGVYVLTNAHVVGSADRISVTLYDGREFEAELVGSDDNRDLALLRFETNEHVPVAVLGDSSELQVGDFVMAFGNPLGFQSTVTAGIVSAVGRRAVERSAVARYTDYVQTDAAINRGNSGGPLVNMDGEVVGINTWIASQTGGSIGIGFAIPINNARSAIDDFIERGEITYGWLGISTGNLLFDLESGRQLDSPRGAFVYGVFERSPAAHAGLRPGDLIVRVGSEPIEDSDELITIIAVLEAGVEPEFGVVRNGRSITIDVEIGARPADDARRNSALWPGFSAAMLSDMVRRELRLPDDAGRIVIRVTSGGPAARAGLRDGDIINAVDRREISSVAQLYELINGANGTLLFSVYRNRREITISMEVEALR